MSGPAIVLVLASTVVSLGAGQGSRKLDKDQEQEGQALVRILQDVGAGQAAPSDFAVTWDNHFLRARDGNTYLPYTVTVTDPASLASPSLAVLVRVVPKGQAPTGQPAVTQANDEKKTADSGGPFLYFVDAKPGQAGQPYRFRRALQVKPGEYDVYVAMKERAVAGKPDVRPRVTVLKHALGVPGFASAEFGLSSVIVAEKAEALTTPATPEQQSEKPYAIGLMDLVPGTKLANTQELTVYFQIYNPAVDAAKKPDLRVDYTFYRRQESGDRALGTETQVQNAATLAPQFEVGKFLLFECRAWPLQGFPTGAYRLDIKVTDKLSGKAITANVGFTVG
jgi:hypothetical protein